MRGNSPIIKSPIACLREITIWVNSVLDLDKLLELIIDTVTRMMEAKASSLLLLDQKTKKLYFKVATGEKSEEVRQYEINVGEGIAGYVAEKGEPLLIPEVRNDSRWDRRISEYTGFQTNSIACVPMKVDGKVIGVVEIIDKEDGSPIQNEDMKILKVFAELASLAISNARKIDVVRRENRDLKEVLENRYQIIGESRSLQKVISDAIKVANSKASTLILGESGTGKELLARLIHKAGPRKSKPMIVLNCAALPETLLEAELFGYEKGAFTGAIKQNIGKFELADGGTLFLDEIGEMSPGMQAKLLRVLQEGLFYRVGGITPISVDVRIISATNRNVQQEVTEGRLREDLYFRLNVVQIDMPSLRERKEDIPILANYFLNTFKQESGFPELKISKKASEKMIEYDWPGNVRELRNAIERAVVMGDGQEILPEDLPIFGPRIAHPGMEIGLSLKNALEKFKKEFIALNLKHTGGNRSKAAKKMGIQRTYLSRLLSQHGLSNKIK
ncbi:MAG: sigma 54-interacting transcriptional regulator [Deltaproteobacteria bacterium]|nr:sigma 54-interacting transcriptional regulator [Deltaproteobacteria bacterium]